MKIGRSIGGRRHERILAVEAGQVVCPDRGVVDLERCWMCPAYAGLSSARIEGVICRVDVGGTRLGILPAVR